MEWYSAVTVSLWIAYGEGGSAVVWCGVHKIDVCCSTTLPLMLLWIFDVMNVRYSEVSWGF